MREEDGGMTKVIAGLAEMGIHVKPAELAKLNPVDGMESALVIMADVRMNCCFRCAH